MALLAALIAIAGAPAHAREGEGIAVVSGFHDALIEAMKGGESLAFDGRAAIISPVIAHSFDMSFMARVTSGSSWKSMSDETRSELKAAFHKFMTANFASNFKNWAGHEFIEESETARGENRLVVRTRLVKPDGDVVRFDYLLRRTGANWRIVDLVVDGKVSELAKRRAEFSPILRKQGPDVLIGALNERSSALASGSEDA